VSNVHVEDTQPPLIPQANTGADNAAELARVGAAKDGWGEGGRGGRTGVNLKVLPNQGKKSDAVKSQSDPIGRKTWGWGGDAEERRRGRAREGQDTESNV